MKTIYQSLLILGLLLAFSGCQPGEGQHEAVATNSHESHDGHTDHDDHEQLAEGQVMLTNTQINALEIRTAPMQKQVLSQVVVANGRLEVPPQGKAYISAPIGANAQKILVVEGQTVKKGAVLAYLEHPEIIQVQLDYQEAYQRLQFVAQDYKRQQELYEQKVASGKQIQEIKANYFTLKGRVNGLKMKLDMLNISAKKVENGDIMPLAAVRAPIDGAVTVVNIATGQYVNPQMAMIELVDPSHVHADLMVYERDVFKVKEGQTVQFALSQHPEMIFDARVISVGKNFEEERKAVHVHAEPLKDHAHLLPGLFIKGNIQTGTQEEWAVPEAAVVEDAGKYFIFTATPDDDGARYQRQEVALGAKSLGLVAVKPMAEMDSAAQVVQNAAYYLLAEMNKEEAEHAH